MRLEHSGDGFSLQGLLPHRRSSIVKPQSPRGASPSGTVCSQFAAFSGQVGKRCSLCVAVPQLAKKNLKAKDVLQRARSAPCLDVVFVLSSPDVAVGGGSALTCHPAEHQGS